MSKTSVFLLGALGGLLPILVSLVTVDLAPIIDHASSLTLGNYVGYAIRVVVLLILGGTIAALNKDVQQPLTLVQLGIAAPALVTSYINGASPATEQRAAQDLFPMIAIARADVVSPQMRIQLARNFISDVITGAGGRLDKIVETPNAPVSYPATAYKPAGDVAASPAGMGNVCHTPSGDFGPGPVASIGTICVVSLPAGPVAGLIQAAAKAN